jgi:hypothetical protein
VTTNLHNYVSLRVRARSSGSYRLAWRASAGGRTLRSRSARVRVRR